MQAKSFIEILANELRKEIRSELEAEMMTGNLNLEPRQKVESSAKADQVQLWLSLKMGGAFKLATNSFTNAYGTKIKNPNSPAKQLSSAAPVQHERKASITTIEQTFALEFFRREGSTLVENFTESELKSEFRKIAMRIHPDRHNQATPEELKTYSSRFQTLVESAETLESALIE